MENVEVFPVPKCQLIMICCSPGPAVRTGRDAQPDTVTQRRCGGVSTGDHRGREKGMPAWPHITARRRGRETGMLAIKSQHGHISPRGVADVRQGCQHGHISPPYSPGTASTGEGCRLRRASHLHISVLPSTRNPAGGVECEKRGSCCGREKGMLAFGCQHGHISPRAIACHCHTWRGLASAVPLTFRISVLTAPRTSMPWASCRQPCKHGMAVI